MKRTLALVMLTVLVMIAPTCFADELVSMTIPSFDGTPIATQEELNTEAGEWYESAVLNEDVPKTSEDKKRMLLCHNIALWDSIASCEIKGSSDASIDKVVPNDLTPLFAAANIQAVFCNGKKAHELYRKYIEPLVDREAICLPSTSPANASWSLEKLIKEYSGAMHPYI